MVAKCAASRGQYSGHSGEERRGDLNPGKYDSPATLQSVPVSTGPLYLDPVGKKPDERIRERDGTVQTWKTSSEEQRLLFKIE